MQHGDQADVRAQMPGIGGDGLQRLGGGLEQQVVDHGLVVEGDGGERPRQGEDDVEVRHGQKVGLALGEPGPGCRALAIGAVAVAAGVVADRQVPAVVAARDVVAEGCGAAGLDGRQDLELAEAQMAGMGAAEGLAMGAQLAMGARDVGQLQGWPRHGRSGRRRPEMGERALDRAEGLQRHPGVERGGVELLVAEQHLDDADVGLALEQMGGEGVPQRMERDPLVERRRRRGDMAGPVELAGGERLGRIAAREQPATEPGLPPPLPQQVQQIGREHDVAVLAALALLDPNQHAGGIDV